MGVLVQLGLSLECCSEGASFWDDLEDPARTPARTGSHAASQLPCLSRCRRCMVPHLCPAYLARCEQIFRFFSEPPGDGGRHVALDPLCCGEDEHSTAVLSGALLLYPSTTAPAHPPYPSLRIDPAQPHLNSRP